MGVRPNLEAVIQALESQLDTIKNYYDNLEEKVEIKLHGHATGDAEVKK